MRRRPGTGFDIDVAHMSGTHARENGCACRIHWRTGCRNGAGVRQTLVLEAHRRDKVGVMQLSIREAEYGMAGLEARGCVYGFDRYRSGTSVLRAIFSS